MWKTCHSYTYISQLKHIIIFLKTNVSFGVKLLKLSIWLSLSSPLKSLETCNYNVTHNSTNTAQRMELGLGSQKWNTAKVGRTNNQPEKSSIVFTAPFLVPSCNLSSPKYALLILVNTWTDRCLMHFSFSSNNHENESHPHPKATAKSKPEGTKPAILFFFFIEYMEGGEEEQATDGGGEIWQKQEIGAWGESLTWIKL